MRASARPSSTNPAAPVTHYGGGVSALGLHIIFRPAKRVEPYFGTDAGVLYYSGRILSPQGSQLMFTIDFSGGVKIFTSRRNAVQLGYRYQHMSNANFSIHIPRTDADTFYIGFSHFHTKGLR